MSPLRRRVGHGLLLVSGLGYCVYFGALMLDTFVLVPLHKGGSIEFLREYYSSPFLPDLAAFFAPVVIPTLVTSILAWVALWKQPRWQAQTVSAIASVTVLLMLLFIFLPINFTPIDEYSDDELLANFSFWMTANWFRLAVVFIGLVGTARALGLRIGDTSVASET